MSEIVEVFYLCKECGSLEWEILEQKSEVVYYHINDNGEVEVESSELIEAEEVDPPECSDCHSQDLICETLPISLLKKLNNLPPEDRLKEFLKLKITELL